MISQFDGSVKWDHTDDPVMGGKSKSTFKQQGGVGTFDGTCASLVSNHSVGRGDSYSIRLKAEVWCGVPRTSCLSLRFDDSCGLAGVQSRRRVSSRA